MHEFALVILMGLAIFKIVDLLEDLIPDITKLHTFVTLALGVGAAMVLDFSVFAGYGIDVREAWMGTAATGLFAAGTTSAWRALFAWFGSSEGDEPAARHQGPRRLAA